MTTFQYLDEGNSEAQDRLATSFLLAQTSPGLARTGVLSGLTVAQTTTASGSVLVAAGAAPVQASVGTGVALLVNDTLKTLDVFTTNPMGALPRNDIVAFDSVTKALIAILGTPNATPDDPTVPDTACPLARLRHAASATTIPTAKIDSLIVRTGLLSTAASTLYATSDVGFPVATTSTGAEVVVDRITIPGATFPRNATISGAVYLWSTQTGRQGASLFVNGSMIDYNLQVLEASTGSAIGAAFPLGNIVSIAANTNAVVELRIQRTFGTGVLTAAIGDSQHLTALTVPA